MLIFSGSSQYPGSSVLDELQLSNGLLWKAGEETITIIHPAGNKGMNKFLQILNGNKTSNSCNVFEMIVLDYRQTLLSPPITLRQPDVAECPAPGLYSVVSLRTGFRLGPICVTLRGSHMCYSTGCS